MTDYYNLLEIPSSAGPAEIRAAFRRKAKEAHPDAHPHLSGGEKEAMQRRFIQLAHAYETLVHPGSRAEYDRKLRAARVGTARAGRARQAPRSGPGARPSAHSRAAGNSQAAGHSEPPGSSRGRPSAGARREAGRRGRSQPADADLDELMKEVGDLLQKFGLDMRNQFAGMLDNMFEWALSVFLEVVSGLEGEKGSAGPRAQPGQGAGADQRANRSAGGGPSPAEEGSASGHARRPGPATSGPEPDFEAELHALKQQVRSAKRQASRAPPTQESVEQELARIKAGMGRKSDKP